MHDFQQYFSHFGLIHLSSCTSHDDRLLLLCCCFTTKVDISGHVGWSILPNHTFPGQA